MSKAAVLQRLASLESKCDVHLFGYRRDPQTGNFVRDDGTESTGSDVAKAGAKVAVTAGAIGAGTAGLKAAHRSVMTNYGGEGGVGQAYRNVARNIPTVVGNQAANGVAAAKSVGKSVGAAVTGAVDRGAAAYGNARTIAGLGGAAAAGRGIKKAINPLISKLRKVTGFDARQRVNELAARLG